MTRMWSRLRPQVQGQGHNPQCQSQGQGRHFVSSGQGKGQGKGQGLTSLILWTLEEKESLLYLLIGCLVQQSMYQSRVHDVEELLDIWRGFEQSAGDRAHNEWRARLQRTKEGHFELWKYANWVRGHWSSDATFHIRMCFSNRLTLHKVIIKVRHGFVIKDWYSNCNTLNFYISHGSATKFLRSSENYYIISYSFFSVFKGERIFKIG